ncbi:MAG: hypothetical protein ACKVHU_15610 [Acidimicrobiales bacterium]
MLSPLGDLRRGEPPTRSVRKAHSRVNAGQPMHGGTMLSPHRVLAYTRWQS